MKLLVMLFSFALVSFGIANAQTPPPGQTTNGPCSPIFNGSGNTNTCTMTPAHRIITMASAQSAISILQTAPTGSKLQMRQVGGSDEINHFFQSVGLLFSYAHVWAAVPGSWTGELTVMNGTSISHGEGIECGGVPGDPAFEKAKAALGAAGYPCQKVINFVPAPNDPNGKYIYIQIGSRIVQD